MTRWAIPLLAFLVLGPWAGSADAHHRHHHARHAAVQKRYSPSSAAYTIAARYWGVQPCNGDIRIVHEPPPKNDEVNANGDQTSLWTSWDPGVKSAENNEDAPKPFWGCVIGINTLVWISEAFEGFNAWGQFCVAFIHEFGHLLGLGHSTDPQNIMSPEGTDHPAICGQYAPGWQP